VEGTWPDGRIDGPPEALYAQFVARKLVTVLNDKKLSRRAAATMTGLDRQTITRLIEGHTVPDFASVAALEAGLDVDLWPSHRDLAARRPTRR